MIVFRGQGRSGCGGCLVVCALFVLAVGGVPALAKALVFFLLAALLLTLVAVALFWAGFRWLRRQDGFRQGAQSAGDYRRVFEGGFRAAGKGAAGSQAQAFAVLGLSPDAGQEEIRRAYRALSMRFHPDRVRHLDGFERRRAEDRMKEINVAYDLLKRRGEPD